VTICHSQTENLSSICKKSDILISAIGKPKFITKEFVNEKMVVIDVGMNLDENNKLCGDVDFEGIKDIVKYITPVPGGVGPMTVTILLRNLIHVTKKQNNLF
jgi:methylenetetrahydrofolate dehydrogenase (NADP+)/methenyltetrahydrofolate cyclohydrolase